RLTYTLAHRETAALLFKILKNQIQLYRISNRSVEYWPKPPRVSTIIKSSLRHLVYELRVKMALNMQQQITIAAWAITWNFVNLLDKFKMRQSHCWTMIGWEGLLGKRILDETVNGDWYSDILRQIVLPHRCQLCLDVNGEQILARIAQHVLCLKVQSSLQFTISQLKNISVSIITSSINLSFSKKIKTKVRKNASSVQTFPPFITHVRYNLKTKVRKNASSVQTFPPFITHVKYNLKTKVRKNASSVQTFPPFITHVRYNLKTKVRKNASSVQTFPPFITHVKYNLKTKVQTFPPFITPTWTSYPNSKIWLRILV
ncbi:hypothetical protein L9F63_001753, partial [Diploptera punctata]